MAIAGVTPIGGQMMRRIRGASLPRGLQLFGGAQAFSSCADALVAVSLADSLFFSISPDASRQQVLLYLVINLVPFTFLAPLIGPAIDRSRRSHRLIATAFYVARAALVVGLAVTLDDLAFYFFALALLIAGKASSVTRQAVVPTLVRTPNQLVGANSRLARLSLIAGSIGGGVGVAVLTLSSPLVTLSIACGCYLVASAFAARLPVTYSRTDAASDAIAADVEFLQLHTPVVAATSWAFTVIRAAVGFFVFAMAFSLRQESEPAFMYGAAAAAWAAGTFAGNVLAPVLRRRTSEARLTAGSLIALSVVAAFGALGPSRLLVLLVAAVLGLAASIGRQGFDALVQSRSPLTRRGSAFARFETRFQLAWVGGAIAATATGVPIRISMAVVALGLVPAAIFYLRNVTELLLAGTEDPAHPLVIARRRLDRLTTAEHRAHPRFVAVELAGVADLIRADHHRLETSLVDRLNALRRTVLDDQEPDAAVLDATLRDTIAAVAALDGDESGRLADTADSITERRAERGTST